VETIRRDKGAQQPCAVVGIGGGSAMDAAKALAIMLSNPGKTHEYQGWDKVFYTAVYKIGVPTISGTGSEVSRTTVLSGPEKKQGINSEHSLFDAIVLDPDLLNTVPIEQRFYTGMDCYIHGVESISGSFLNEFSEAFAGKSLDLCRRVFLHGADDSDLMVASYMGGCAIVYSEVGVCHALSYGISHAFGIHHGVGNCIVFDHLDQYYPKALPEFRKMLDKNGVSLPRNFASDIDDATLERMIDITLLMEKPLHNALGPKWKEILTRSKIRDLYLKILRM
jgi:3-deoxy-alpha-D-manno-octulosonate 8-oxidase